MLLREIKRILMSSSISPPRLPRRAKNQQVYACDRCNASFRRQDHLHRHYRAHTKQRPFACPVCSKGFARRDLMVRHKKNHSGSPNIRRESLDSSANVKYRVAQACRRCASSKLKCTDQKPCQRCQNKNIPCETTAVPDPFVEHGPSGDNSNAPSSSPGGQQNSTTSESTIAGIQPFCNSFSLLPFGGEDCSFSTGDTLDLSDMDFSFLNSISTFTDMDSPCVVPPPNETMSPIMPMRSQVYKLSSVVQGWMPLSTENSHMEQAHLSINGEVPGFTPQTDTTSILVQPFPHFVRDRVLNMVFIAYSDRNPRIVESFPSSEVLFKLANRYITRKKVRHINDLIHIPTFDWNSSRPELIAAMIAMGAVDSPSVTLRKFGFALQLTVRRATMQRYEEDHTTMRALDMAQAFLLQQYMGIFSGISRKIGLAESCFMIVPTIISQARRLLLLDAEPYFDAALESDCVERLDSIWRRWCEQESMRRLIYHSFVLDCHTSITRNTNPTLSYASMDIPLPCPKQLWHAETAAIWKDGVLKLSSPAPPPSLKELIQDPQLLGTCKDRVDTPFMQSVYLSGMWSMVREYRQLSSIAAGSSTWNTLVLSSRHAELQSVMKLFPLNSCSSGPLTPEIAFLYNLVSMHLHVSFNDLQPSSVGESFREEFKTAVYAESWMQ
ncbi:hypothetical protein ASPVEDRAFT_179613, partial [Aspergillus versicolor CBS 583.65]